MNKLLLIPLFVFLFFPFVFSANPLTQTPSIGINIEHPIADTVALNQTHKFHFHIFNATSGVPFVNSTSTIVCIFHLYDPSGSHLVKVNKVLSDDTYDWEQIIYAGNFTSVGQYSYVFQCNDTAIGGFYEHDFMVTQSGQPLPSDSLKIFFIGLFLILTGSLLYLFVVGLAHSFTLDYDIIDLAQNLGLYLVMFGSFMFEQYYLGDPNIQNIMPILLSVTAYTHVMIPFLSLGISLIVGSLLKGKLNAGRIETIHKRGWRYDG